MKILFATSEAHPLIKTGGLADVSGSLPNALAQLKHRLRLVLPAYQSVMAKIPPKAYRVVAQTQEGGCNRDYDVRILQVKAGAIKGMDVPVWLVDIPELYDRPGNPYLAADGGNWWDNGERFAVFAKVVTELAMDRLGLRWQPEVVHVNDWQTGLVPALLSVEQVRPKTVFTIHNMAYPGNFPKALFDSLALPHALWSMHGVEFWGHFSMLKAGIACADWVTTVSPTYAKEITFPEFAYGFEGILQARLAQGRLVGILNGIDEQVWNPATDSLIVKNYSLKKGRVVGKAANKASLLGDLCLLRGEDEKHAKKRLANCMDKPLIGFVGRLVLQKGVDLVLQVMPELIAQSDAHFVFVGSGEKAYEQQITALAQKYPTRVWAFIGYSESLAHRVEAGADMFLMPSRFEPCGLNQMYSLAYGTLPIVHNTGGLADTVVNATEENLANETATGFVFYDPSYHALKSTIMHGLYLFRKPRSWQKLQKTAMAKRFDWTDRAKDYIQIYQKD